MRLEKLGSGEHRWLDRRAEHRGVAGSDRGVAVLCAAVLLLALQDARRGGRLRREALKWMREAQPGYVFSFESLCHALDVDQSAFLRIARRRPQPGWPGTYRLC